MDLSPDLDLNLILWSYNYHMSHMASGPWFEPQLYVHLTHKNVAHDFDSWRDAWMMSKSGCLQIRYPDKTEFIIFG